jgi:hypothetical protein
VRREKKMKKLIVSAAIVAVVVIAATLSGTAQATRFSHASFSVDSFNTQLRTDLIYWTGPDGVVYPVDRWYEYTATLRWSHFPASATEWLRVFDPSKDESTNINVSGLHSYTFSGTLENSAWAFPGDTISFELTVCFKPTYTTCLTFQDSAQVPS